MAVMVNKFNKSQLILYNRSTFDIYLLSELQKLFRAINSRLNMRYEYDIAYILE